MAKRQRTEAWRKKRPAARNHVQGCFAHLGIVYTAINPRMGQIWVLHGIEYVVMRTEFVDYMDASSERDDRQIYNVWLKLKSEIELFMERFGSAGPMQVLDYDWSEVS